MKKFHLLAASALAVIAAYPAQAQAQDTPPPASGTDYTSANDIVVTATRRDETVQDVPIAITAVGAELLRDAGVTDLRGLEQLAPSLQTSTGQSSATGTTLYIRGIGTGGDNPGFEPAVGVFIDGVFRSRAGIAISELPELERVEILRGPQGTLFGRNTSAGALSIATAQPKFELGGYVEAGYGNYNAYELKGAITGPVAESLALRVDGGYRKRDGYIDDVNSDRSINDINRYYVRAQALYDTTDLTIRLIGDYYKTDEQCCGAVSGVRGGLAPVVQAVAGMRGRTGLYTGAPGDRRQAISPNRDYLEAVTDWGVSGEINYSIGDLKLTSITAYRSWKVRRNQDVDFSGVDRAYREGYRSSVDDFTQEFRVQGTAFDGKLDFLVGGFYLNENLKVRDTVRFGQDANLYVDSIFALNPAAGFQFYGSYGVPSLAAIIASRTGGPALPASQRPLLGQLLYLGSPQLQAAAPPGSPLFNYLMTPLPGVTPGQGNNNDDFEVKTQAFALFTHNIIDITDNLSLTLGARWNYEKKELNATIASNTGSCAFFFDAGPLATTYRNAAIAAVGRSTFDAFYQLSCNPAVSTAFNGSYTDNRSESRITGTAKLAYKFSDKVLGYASYDRGYKSGGYNLDQATFDAQLIFPTNLPQGNGAQASDLAFGSETVDSFEIGFKTSFSRAFTFNIAAFYAKYGGLQSLIFSGNNFVVQNIDDSTGKGVEMEAIVQPVRDLVFRFGYAYLDAGYDKSNNFAGTPLSGQEGQQFLNQPKHVVSVAGTWTPPLTTSISGLLHVDMRYNSDVVIDGTGNVANDGYPIINARIGIQSADRSKSLEFYVENLTNQYYNITGFAVPEQNGNYAFYPNTPRFYGVKARFGF